LDIYEFRSFELYRSMQILGIFPIEIEYFFEKFLSILFRIRIVSNRTTSISVKVYEYHHYLLITPFSFPGLVMKTVP
jgi:hypothetical protein